MTGPIRKDLVAESSTTVGTGAYALTGPLVGSQGFVSIGDGNTCHYVARDIDLLGNPTGAWEIGLGTYSASGNTLTRTSILTSSNGGAAVSWTTGVRRIELDFPASSIAALEAALIGGGGSGSTSTSLGVSPFAHSLSAYMTSIGFAFTPASLASGSTTFGTDVAAPLQALFNLNNSGGPLHIIIDVPCSVTVPMLINGLTRVTQLPGCGVMGRSGFTFTNKNPVVTDGTPVDDLIIIEGGILHGNNQASTGSGANARATSTVVNGVNIWGRTLGFFNPKALLVRDIEMRDPWGYHFLVSGGGQYVFDNIKLVRGPGPGSADGVHVVGGTVRVTNIYGQTYDDMVSICGRDGNAVGATGGAAGVYGPYVTGGFVDAYIENIVPANGGGIRLLPVDSSFHATIKHFGGGCSSTALIIDDDEEDGIPGTRSQDVVISVSDMTTTTTNVPPVGNPFYKLFLGNCRIRGTINTLVLDRVNFRYSAATNGTIAGWFASCKIGTLIIKDFVGTDLSTSGSGMAQQQFYFDKGASVKRLILDSPSIQRSGLAQTNAPLLYLDHGAGTPVAVAEPAGTIDTIEIRGGKLESIVNGINWLSGTINEIKADLDMPLSYSGKLVNGNGQTLKRLVVSRSAFIPGDIDTASTVTTKSGSYYIAPIPAGPAAPAGFTKPLSPALQSGNSLSTGLVRAFVFNEGSGTTIHDYSSNAAHSTTQGSPAWATDSTYGAYLVLTGSTSQFAQGADTNMPTGTSPRSFMFVCSNLSANAGAGFIMGYGTGSPTNAAYGIGFSNPGAGSPPTPPRSLLVSTLAAGVRSTGSIPQDAFTVFVITDDGTNTSFYINGALDSTLPSTGHSTVLAGVLQIGTFANSNAAVNMVAFSAWNIALTQSQVSALQSDPYQMVRP